MRVGFRFGQLRKCKLSVRFSFSLPFCDKRRRHRPSAVLLTNIELLQLWELPCFHVYRIEDHRLCVDVRLEVVAAPKHRPRLSERTCFVIDNDKESVRTDEVPRRKRNYFIGEELKTVLLPNIEGWSASRFCLKSKLVCFI